MVRGGRAVTIANHQVGGDERCFIIAELGVNHGGSVETAVALVNAAADAGADAVKLQTFAADRLAATDAPLAEYQERATSGTQHDLLRGLELDELQHRTVQHHAVERGLVFLSTPFDVESARMLVGLGVPAIKIGSGEVTNLPFLREIGSLGEPVLLSTGMSTLDEVAEAVDVLGDAPLVLLHCVSSYPAEPADANLRAMATMRERFDVPVGFSDHTRGIEIAPAAVALGACVIEKHLTLDRDAPGPDHLASLEPSGFADMVASIRHVESALGDGRKEPRPAEANVARVARRSVAAGRDLRPGDVLVESDLVLLRPGTGMPPSAVAALIGRTVNRHVHAGSLLREDDLA